MLWNRDFEFEILKNYWYFCLSLRLATVIPYHELHSVKHRSKSAVADIIERSNVELCVILSADFEFSSESSRVSLSHYPEFILYK